MRLLKQQKLLKIHEDVNITLINELALIFNKLGLDTLEVLKAAGTKWNFLPFRPGLVGNIMGVEPILSHAQAKKFFFI